ncbi:MAG: SurA N-terminal domain-containing protein [Campylobacterota bacterium]|nr:SurA N-terminal domain-containing protein [Campylobacterota bacterium]
MQKHKKWLIVTIWISTIAFVGAGFVGWGSYDYGKSNSTVAIVGEKEVPLTDLQNEYSALYSQYQQMFGETFNQELAKQLKLEDAALQRVTQKYLLLNFAEDLGLAVTDKEMVKELVKINAFYKDGKFDKNTYMSVLKQNRRTVAEFEDQLKKDLLVSKVQKLFGTELLDSEIKNISSLLYSQDKVSIVVLDKNDIKVDAKSKDIKKYWEETKDNYKSDKGIKIAFVKVDNIDGKTKKEMRKTALREYLSLKKSEKDFSETKVVYDNSEFVTNEDYKNLLDLENNSVLKPVYIKDSYFVLQKLDIIAPTTLPFEEVKSEVEIQYNQKIKADMVKDKVSKIKENFNGRDLGYIQRDSKPYIKGVSEEDVSKFVQQLFASSSSIDSFDLANKIIVYKITDTKLATYDKKNDETVKSIFTNVKNNSISNGLLEQLKNRYEIKSFMGSN